MDGLQVQKKSNLLLQKKQSIINENTSATTKEFLVHPVKEVYVSKNDVTKALRAIVLSKAKEVGECFNTLLKNLKEEASGRFIEMESPHVWFDRDVSALWPYEIYSYSRSGDLYMTFLSDKDTDYYSFSQMLGDLQLPSVGSNKLLFNMPTKHEVETTFDKNNQLPIGDKNSEAILCGVTLYYSLVAKDGNKPIWFDNRNKFESRGRYGYNYRTFGGKSDHYDYLRNSKHFTIRIHRLRGTDAKPLSFAESVEEWLKNGLIPKGLMRNTKKIYKDFVDNFSILSPYIYIKGDNELIFDSEDFVSAVIAGEFTGKVFGFNFNYTQIESDVNNGKASLGDIKDLQDMLLKCDYKRANLRIYPEKRLTDQGHWDLCEEPEDKTYYAKVKIDDSVMLLARPPQLDVKSNKVCAIDFGTKSTVVAVYDAEEYLLRVGQPDLLKEESDGDYENPTIIEWRDIEAFMKAYNARSGRPFTEWNQVTVAHSAKEALNQSNSHASKSIFSELKQWTHDGSGRFIRDIKGATRDVKPFLQLQPGDFNPLEIYAYYLGLYINNMDQGICLEYVMSFPVNFEKDVRNQIIASFTRGLNKSLPMSLGHQVNVYPGASEPAAYAITALKDLGLQPKKENEQVAYGVFDFGGGTTDFDFGIEVINVPKRGKPFIEVHQVGNGGDAYLGGENILQLLAYQVYEDNFKVMKEKQIPLVLPELVQGQAFSGSEILVRPRKYASQAAQLNIKHLAEALRDIWEHKGNYKEKYGKDDLKLVLYSDAKLLDDKKEQSDSFTIAMKVNVDKLESLIATVVERGVINYFAKCRLAFSNYETMPLPINILLAGNSSRAKIVKELFEKHIDIETEYIKNIRPEVNEDGEQPFTLRLPLEIEKDKETKKLEPDKSEAVKPQKTQKNAADPTASIKKLVLPNNGTNTSDSSSSKRIQYKYLHTGKTGVAFGLLQSRKGARRYSIINDIVQGEQGAQFKYYIGSPDLEDMFVVDVKLEDGWNEWIALVPADEEYFEFYYTSEPRAEEGSIPISDVKQYAHLKINEVSTDEDTYVFIHKKDSETIEYAVGKEEEFKNFDPSTSNKMVYTYKL